MMPRNRHFGAVLGRGGTERRLQRVPGLHPLRSPPKKRRSMARKQAMRDEASAAPESKWSEMRRKIAQLVWGDGFNSPGGVAMATELSQPLGLDKSSSMIELGASMGGATREIAAAVGAYVTAWEIDPELAEEGAVQADVVGL